jgi:hypothetical protein
VWSVILVNAVHINFRSITFKKIVLLEVRMYKHMTLITSGSLSGEQFCFSLTMFQEVSSSGQ